MASVELSGREKAAILLITLGSSISSEILKYLKDDDIEKLILDISRQRKLSQDNKDRVARSVKVRTEHR